MPVNKAYPLEKLLPAIKAFNEKHGRMVTLEFILIEEVNDMLDQAEKLRDIARDLHAHVNLIPYNTVEGLPWKRPSVTRQERFADILRAARLSVIFALVDSLASAETHQQGREKPYLRVRMLTLFMQMPMTWDPAGMSRRE